MTSLPKSIRVRLAARLFTTIAMKHEHMEDGHPAVTELEEARATEEQMALCAKLRIFYNDVFELWCA